MGAPDCHHGAVTYAPGTPMQPAFIQCLTCHQRAEIPAGRLPRLQRKARDVSPYPRRVGMTTRASLREAIEECAWLAGLANVSRDEALSRWRRVLEARNEAVEERDAAHAAALREGIRAGGYERERDEARAALRWLASRYIDCGGTVARDGFTRYGSGITDAEWAEHVAPHLETP